MLIIKRGGPVSSIHRRAGEIQPGWYQVNKVYISRYDSIDISLDNNVTIIINDNLYYTISINTNVEEYVDTLLKQSIRQEKLEEVLK